MSTRFFRTALTTGMTGSSIDPDLAASLKARDRHAAAGARGTIGFSTLLCERWAGSAGAGRVGAWLQRAAGALFVALGVKLAFSSR